MPPPKRNESPPKRKESIAMADCVFPEDMMLCILTRLPVKSILRFKSVCKPWCELLSTREFMKMHNGQFSSDPKNQSFIIKTLDYGGPFDGLMSLLNIESDEKKPSILDHPCPETHFMKIVGCCNGLLCMGRPPLGHGIVLWNPAMKLFKFVRLLENVDFTDPKMVALGFGYDAEGDDFKVVRIVCLKGENKSIGVEVYSVNSDSWVTIKPGFQFSVSETENIAIVNGNPYWVTDVDENESGKGEVLVFFDVRKMVVKVVPLSSHIFNAPVDWNGSLAALATSHIFNALMDWNGSLAALATSYYGGDASLHVWVFDDGEQIWRKNHTFGPIIKEKVGRFLQWSKNGKVLGERPNGKLFVFDPENGCVKVYYVQMSPLESYPCPYTESLTYIKGMRPVQVNTGRLEEDDPWRGH